jgi:hypothetical protein
MGAGVQEGLPVRTPSEPRRRPRRVTPLLLAGGLYLLGALALDHRVLPRLGSATTGWISADSDTFAWWLQWLPVALGRGEDPLLTDYVHAPYGINAMWNIPVTAIAVLVLPVTLLAGPVAAYNVAMLLGPVVSGVLTAAALVPWTERWTSRIVAGGLYAFSPYLVAHFLVGHLNLVWAVLPPVLLIAARALFIETPRHPVRVGVLLGLAVTLQLGIYTQTLALGALVLVLTAVVLACAWPRAVRPRLPVIGRVALGWVPTVALLCAYPVYLVLFGPARPSGQIRPALDVRADPLNAVLPTPVTVGGSAANSGHLNAYVGEQGGYLGVVVLLLLVVACVVSRSATVRVVAVLGLLTWVLSLGPSLTVGGDDLGVWLPWQLLTHVPLLSVAEPVRLQLFVTFAVAVVVALWLDRLQADRWGARRVAGTVLTVLAVASWLPAGAAETAAATSPAFFRTADQHLARSDVVVTYPRPDGRWTGGALPILWQAESRMAYRTTGGSFLSSDPTHDLLYETPENLYEGACRGLLAGLPPSDDGYVAAARQQLLDLGVTVVLVVPQPGEDYTRIERFTARVTGTPGQATGGVRIYRLAG